MPRYGGRKGTLKTGVSNFLLMVNEQKEELNVVGVLLFFFLMMMMIDDDDGHYNY